MRVRKTAASDAPPPPAPDTQEALAIEVLADVGAKHAAAWAAADRVALPADTGGSSSPLRPLGTYLLQPPTSEAECKRVLQALAADARARAEHAAKARRTAASGVPSGSPSGPRQAGADRRAGRCKGLKTEYYQTRQSPRAGTGARKSCVRRRMTQAVSGGRSARGAP